MQKPMHSAWIRPWPFRYHLRMADRHERIGAVSKLLGVPVPTIRSWERRYGFPTPPRTGGSHRRYRREEIEQLGMLRDLVTNGLSTRDAIGLVRRTAIASDGVEVPYATVVRAAMALDPARIRTALDAAADRIGVEDAITAVALPAMRDIGDKWAVGRCDVEQEHLATEAVRAWLGRQAFLATPPFRPRPVVLACGPDDLHTIGLEAFATILARRGWPTRVLGARTPADALVGAVRTVDAVAAVVTAQRGVTRRSAAGSIAAVDRLRGVHGFYAGAAFTAPAARRDIRGVYLGEELPQGASVVERYVGSLR